MLSVFLSLSWVDSGIKLQEDKGDIVSLQDETSPCFELKEKFECIDYIVYWKNARWAETSS